MGAADLCEQASAHWVYQLDMLANDSLNHHIHDAITLYRVTIMVLQSVSLEVAAQPFAKLLQPSRSCIINTQADWEHVSGSLLPLHVLRTYLQVRGRPILSFISGSIMPACSMKATLALGA